MGDNLSFSSNSKNSNIELVKRRLNALKNLQFKSAQLEVKFYEELYLLECKYNKLTKPINEKRKKIINGDYEPTDEDAELLLNFILLEGCSSFFVVVLVAKKVLLFWLVLFETRLLYFEPTGVMGALTFSILYFFKFQQVINCFKIAIFIYLISETKSIIKLKLILQ